MLLFWFLICLSSCCATDWCCFCSKLVHVYVLDPAAVTVVADAAVAAVAAVCPGC